MPCSQTSSPQATTISTGEPLCEYRDEVRPARQTLAVNDLEVAINTALSLIAIWLLINALFFVLMTPVDRSDR